jgi:hypothetical protein
MIKIDYFRQCLLISGFILTKTLNCKVYLHGLRVIVVHVSDAGSVDVESGYAKGGDRGICALLIWT